MKALEVTGLSYRYPDGTPALDGVSFALAEGESVGLIGPNGAGKSTLLLHLNGLLPDVPPAEPAVRVLGQPLTRDRLPGVRREVGLLFQDPDDQLFCPTVREDVAFGPSKFGWPAPISPPRSRAGSPPSARGLRGPLPHHLSRARSGASASPVCSPAPPRLLVFDERVADLDSGESGILKASSRSSPGDN